MTTPTLAMHKPTIEVPGPFAIHDQACAVCHRRHAVYYLNDGAFDPCWECQGNGWRLHRPPRSFFARLVRWYDERTGCYDK